MKFTKEHKKKISDALKGRKHSVDHNRKIGLSKIGNKNMLGKHHSSRSKKLIRLAHLGMKRTEECNKKIRETRRRNGCRSPMFGLHHSDNTRKKMSEARRGDKHPLWRGGITKLRKRIRSCFKYKLWSGKILKRDNWTCRRCNKLGGVLDAHHIISFSSIIRDNNIISLGMALKCVILWDTNNGITLCRKCHRKTDSWGNKSIK